MATPSTPPRDRQGDPSDEDRDLSLVVDLASRMRRNPGEFSEETALAGAADAAHAADAANPAGIGSSQLDRLFLRHYQTTPAAFLLRARLDTVCRQLLAGRRSARDLALAAGWESAAAFDDSFKQATGLSPGEYRKLPRERSFVLELPAGYRAGETLRYLGRDRESRSERVAGTTFGKGVRLDGLPALLTVEIGEGVARCRVHAAES